MLSRSYSQLPHQRLVNVQVYRGTELWTDSVTPSFWGRYDKLICVGSLSKAFGLPGLRLGWLVTQPEMVDLACTRNLNNPPLLPMPVVYAGLLLPQRTTKPRSNGPMQAGIYRG